MNFIVIFSSLAKRRELGSQALQLEVMALLEEHDFTTHGRHLSLVPANEILQLHSDIVQLDVNSIDASGKDICSLRGSAEMLKKHDTTWLAFARHYRIENSCQSNNCR